MNWSIELYTAIIDTGILILLVVWSCLDHKQIYFGDKDK